MPRLVLFFVLVLCASTSPIVAQHQVDVASEEYRVYEAVLGIMDHIPKTEPHVAIFDVTLTSKCGEDAYPLPLFNGCSFLWVKPDIPSSIKRLLRESGMKFDDSTWKDFEAKNSASAKLHEPLSTPWKHKLTNPEKEPPKDWESPDLTIFLSRPGFNANKTEAILYVLTFSYMQQVNTEGDYFEFRKNRDDQWLPNGRVTYLSLDKDHPPQ